MQRMPFSLSYVTVNDIWFCAGNLLFWIDDSSRPVCLALQYIFETYNCYFAFISFELCTRYIILWLGDAVLCYTYTFCFSNQLFLSLPAFFNVVNNHMVQYFASFFKKWQHFHNLQWFTVFIILWKQISSNVALAV